MFAFESHPLGELVGRFVVERVRTHRDGGPTNGCSGRGRRSGNERSVSVITTRCFGAIALLLCSASTFPSEPRAVAVGSRVRVSAAEVGAKPLIGSVVGLEPHAVLVRGERSGPPTRVALGPTTTIEVSGGRRSKAGRGAVLGAAVGAMPGLLMTFGDYNTDPEYSPGAVAAVGAAAGAVVGAAIGWALKSEKWLPAEAPSVTAGIAPRRGGVGFSLHVAWGRLRHSRATEGAAGPPTRGRSRRA